MTGELLAQLVLNGLALGAAYGLVALGFVLVLNATGAVNFAAGDLVMAGGFVAVALASLLPLPGVLLLPLVALAMGGVGWLVGQIAYRPLAARPPVAIFISTIAIGILLQNGANALFGPVPRQGPALAGEGALQLADLAVSRQQLAILITAVLLGLALGWLFRRTTLGYRLRAAAEDPETARAIGIRVGRMTALSFAMGGALAGLAGLLLSHSFFITPSDGGAYMLKAYIAVVIGGWGRLGGAAAGAVLVGLFETVVSGLVSHLVAEALLYGAVLLILAWRPEGLFGEVAGRRA